MIRAILSHNRKGQGKEQYSSLGYHCSMEIELADDLRQHELKGRIHDTYDLLRQIVDEELVGRKDEGTQVSDERPEPGDDQASNAQIKFLTDLARQNNISFEDLNKQVTEMYGAESVYKLRRRDCSRLINDMKRSRRRAA